MCYFKKYESLIYSGSTFVQSAAKINANNASLVSGNLTKLKKGESATTNILGLVETGDASIAAAVKNGGISQISYIDVNEKMVFIFWRKVTITVYGE